MDRNYCDRCDGNTYTYCEKCECYLCDGCWDIVHSGRKLSLHEKGTHVVDKSALYDALALSAHNINRIQKDIEALDPVSINKVPTLRGVLEDQIDAEFNRLYQVLCDRRMEAFKLVDQKASDLMVNLKSQGVEYQKIQSSLRTHILEGNPNKVVLDPYVSNIRFDFTVTHGMVAPLLELVTISGTYHVLTKDGVFKGPHTGYVTIILIGGGASGGQGGSGYRGGGGSGYVVVKDAFFMEKDHHYPVTIGKGGHFDHQSQSHGANGSKTVFDAFSAEGGNAPLKYEGGLGGSDGGKGGHQYPEFGVNGRSLIHHSLMNKSNIRGGQGGRGGNPYRDGYAGGGGGGGLFVTGYQLKASDGNGHVNHGYGGEGFGAGGGGGGFAYIQNKYGAGGNGSDGCCIIIYN